MNYVLTVDETIADELVDVYSSLMPSSRRFLYAQCKDRLTKKQILTSYLLLCYSIYDKFGVDNLRYELSYHTSGKPYLTDYPQIHFNLSHSAGYILCSISDREIGCDIQEKDGEDVSLLSMQESLFKLGVADASECESFFYSGENYVLSVSQAGQVDGDITLVDCHQLMSFVQQRSSLCLYLDLNRNANGYSDSCTPLELFLEQVESHPSRLAVSYKGRGITYGELDRYSSALASRLSVAGVQNGDRVLLSIPAGIEFSVAEWAIIKCGACYVPLNSRWPIDRINQIVDDSGAQVMVIDSSRQFADCKVKRTVLCKTEIADDTPFVVHMGNENDPFYMIYTSGSTGRPKGVSVSNKNLACFASRVRGGYFDTVVKSPANVACICSVSFDMSVGENTVTLLNGGSVFFADSEDQLPDNFASFILKNKIDVIWATPSKFKMYLKTPSCFTALNSLRAVVLAGEILDSELAELAQAYSFRLFNTYAPTETTIISTYHLVDTTEKNIPIGVPFTGESCYVVSEDGTLCEAGERGELYVGGDGVAIGYYNNPSLTDERFVDNPFGDGRLYRTGDIVSLDPRGYIRFYGRKDNQMKVNGFRVELEEIEAAIYAVAHIKSVVLFHNGNLIAVTEGESIDPISLGLESRLPDYMLPAIYCSVREFPLNPNGKTDRSRLREYVIKQISTSIYRAPETDLQVRIIEAWESVLSYRPIGIDDPFNLIGGNSIDAMRISNDLIKQGISVSMQDILGSRTVSRLAERIERGREPAVRLLRWSFSPKDCAPRGSEIAEDAILQYADNFSVRTPEVIYAPLGFNRSILDITHDLEVRVYKLSGTVGTDRLICALRELIKNNPAFRTLYHSETGMLHQFDYHSDWQIPILEASRVNKEFENKLNGFYREGYRYLSFCFILKDGKGDAYIITSLSWAFTDHFAQQVIYDQLTRSLNGWSQEDAAVGRGPYEFTQLVRQQKHSFMNDASPELKDKLSRFAQCCASPAVQNYLAGAECTHYQCVIKPDAALKIRFLENPINFLIGLFAPILRESSGTEAFPIYVMDQNRNDLNRETVYSVIDFVPILTTEGTEDYYSTFNEILRTRTAGDLLIDNQNWNSSIHMLPFVNFIPTMSESTELAEQSKVSYLVMQKEGLDKTPSRVLSLSAYVICGELILDFDVPMNYDSFRAAFDKSFNNHLGGVQ